MIGPLGRLAVRLAHEVVREWRRLEPVPAGRQEMSRTYATTERAPTWDFDNDRPTARIDVIPLRPKVTGFGLPERLGCE